MTYIRKTDSEYIVITSDRHGEIEHARFQRHEKGSFDKAWYQAMQYQEFIGVWPPSSRV